MSVKIFDLQTGKEIAVTWFDKDYVYFKDGTSCARKDIAAFFGDSSEIMLKNLQSIVDNYLVYQKKFDYPGKPKKKSRAFSKQRKLLYKDFDADSDKLCELQPPESLTQDLLAHGAGVWIQKANNPYISKSKHDSNAPWIWLWSPNIKIYRSVGHDKIKEWLDIIIMSNTKSCDQDVN